MLSKRCLVPRIIALLAVLTGSLASNSLTAASNPPLELSQLKAYLANHSLQAAAGLVKERGIRFVPTQEIKKQIEESIPLIRKDARNYVQELGVFWETLDQNEPKELVIAVAPFCGGIADQVQNIQVAMVAKLRSLAIGERPFMIFPVRLDKCLSTEGGADEVGQANGVHIVVWGDWSRMGDVDRFVPKLRVTQPFGTIASLNNVVGRETSFTFRLEPLEPLRVQLASAARPNNSDLIPLLIGLSLYRKKDYQSATRVLASVSSPSSDVYIYLAICSLALNDSEAASQYLANAEKIGEASLEAFHDLGTLAAQAGDFDRALDYLDKALKIDPHSYKTLNNKAIVLAMKEARNNEERGQTGKPESEESCSQEAIDTIKESREWGGPSYLSAVYNHAAILLNCAGYASTALEGVQILRGEYLARKADDHKAWALCGGVYKIDLHKFKEAEDCYLEAVRHSSSSDEYWDYLINTLTTDSDSWKYERRSTFFSTLLSLLPRSNLPKEDRLLYQETALSGLALALASDGRLREARATFAKLPVRIDDLGECEDRLVYQLAVEQITTPLRSDSDFMSRYLLTVYQHFFLVNDIGDLVHRSGPVLGAYKDLLQRAPSDVATELGEVLLQYKILLQESSVAETHRSFVQSELLPRLKKALGVMAPGQNAGRYSRGCVVQWEASVATGQ